jgi:hypothetical protein
MTESIQWKKFWLHQGTGFIGGNYLDLVAWYVGNSGGKNQKAVNDILQWIRIIGCY